MSNPTKVMITLCFLTVWGCSLAVIGILGGQTNVMKEPTGLANKHLLAEGVYDFALSADGEQIAFWDHEGLKRIFLKNGKRELLLRFPPNLRLPSGALRSGIPISWSHDASQLASVRDRAASELIVLDVQSKELRIFDQAPFITGIAWSPDGKQLAWFRRTNEVKQLSPSVRAAANRLMVSPLQDGKVIPKALFEGLSSAQVRWTPDCQYLVFSQGGERIGLVKSDGTGLRWLAPQGRFPSHGNFAIHCWAISSDGQMIAFGHGSGIWLCQLKSGAEPFRIAPYMAIELCWSPDNKSMLLITASPKSPPPAPGNAAISPSHELHWLTKDGKEHRILGEEAKGIYHLHWRTERDILYISDKSLRQTTLK